MITGTVQTFRDEATAKLLPPPAKASARDYAHESIPNFYVSVLKAKLDGSVTRVYKARYTEATDDGQKERRPKLGTVGETRITAALALLESLLKEVREARTEGRAVVPTFADAFKAFLRHKEFGVARDQVLRARTLEDYQDRFDQLVPPWLAAGRLDALTWERWAHFRSWVTSEERTRTTGRAPLGEARVDGFLRGVVSGVYNHWSALIPGKLQNPVAMLRARGVLSKPQERQDHVKAKDLPKAASVILSQMSPAARDLVLIALCTSWRDSLVKGILISRIDEGSRTVGWSMKDPGGPYDKDPEIDGVKVPFAYPVADWLWDTVFAPRLLMRRPGQKYLIESNRNAGKPFIDTRQQQKKLDQALGYHITGHSLRRTFATLAASTDAAPAAVTHLMMHKTAMAKLGMTSDMTLKYTQRDTEAMRKAANVVVSEIVRAMALSTSAPAYAGRAKGERQQEGKEVANTPTGTPAQGATDLAALLANLSPDQMSAMTALLKMMSGAKA